MSEHHEHTEFLKHCLRYDDSPERHAITEKLSRLQGELGVVKRLARLTGIFIVVAGVSLLSRDILPLVFPYHVQQFIVNMVLGLFTGSSFCFLTFIVLGIFLYRKLHLQREACRQLLMRLFAARLAAQRS